MVKITFSSRERSWIETPAMIQERFETNCAEAEQIKELVSIQKGSLKLISKNGRVTLGFVFPLLGIGVKDLLGFLVYTYDNGKYRHHTENTDLCMEDVEVGYTSNEKEVHLEVIVLDGEKALSCSQCYTQMQ